ncbi:hypothetical protein WUBG_03419, partial [Wuchereria bancrofti]
KVGHSSAVPRSTLVYNGRRNLPTRSGICERTLNQYGAHSEKPCRNEMYVVDVNISLLYNFINMTIVLLDEQEISKTL